MKRKCDTKICYFEIICILTKNISWVMLLCGLPLRLPFKGEYVWVKLNDYISYTLFDINKDHVALIFISYKNISLILQWNSNKV